MTLKLKFKLKPNITSRKPLLRSLNRKKVLFLVLLALLIINVIGVIIVASMHTQIKKKIVLYKIRHNILFDYIASLRPNILYNVSVIKPGETTYLKLVKVINVTETYRVYSDKNIRVEGTHTCSVLLEAPGEWKKELYKCPSTNFRSNYLDVKYTFNVSKILSYIDIIRKETGISTNEYVLTIKPKINVKYYVDNYENQETLTPYFSIIFDIQAGKLHFKQSNSTYVSDKVETIVKTNYVNIFGLMIEVIKLKILLYFTLVLVTTSFILNWVMVIRKKERKDIVSMINAKYKDLIIEAKDLKINVKNVVDVRNIEDLVKIASNLGKPILHIVLKEKKHVYHVVDKDILYRLIV